MEKSLADMSLLQQALAITKDFDELISNESWDELEALTKQRQEKLESFFGHPVDERDKASAMEHIRKIMTLDESYKEKIKSAKVDFTHQTLGIRKKLEAAQAYQTINDRK